MVSLEDIDDDLEEEISSECSRYGNVSKVLIHQERNRDGEIIVKVFVVFNTTAGKEKSVKQFCS